MKAFYRIENNQAQVGSGEFVPESYIEYTVGAEPEELVLALEQEQANQVKQQQLAEANQYFKDTAWIWEKYNRNVVMLGDLTADEFRVKYADIIAKQEEARALINELGGN